MNEKEKLLLAGAIATRLEYLWRICDLYDDRYEWATDECSALHRLVRDYDIKLPQEIEARF